MVKKVKKHEIDVNEVKVLIEGYATISDDGWRASSTVSLITTPKGIKILADPGANKELLLKQLVLNDITVNDIDYIFLTHLHLDHSLLMALFPKAKVVNHEAVTYGENGEVVGDTIPETNIKIMKTPGHEYAHAVLSIPTNEGLVVVAGDNFWWTTDEEQFLDLNKKDDFAETMDELIEGRKKLLAIADWIIPGHGKKMQIKKQ
jgi:glyoxylase-like metal-dependent hydrolase (beta-lactamase superfamily II)